MKLFKNLKFYLVLVAIIVIGVLLILNKFLVYGLVAFGCAALIFSIWQLFIRDKENEISNLNSQLKKGQERVQILKAENEELRNRKLHVSDIRSVLDLGLMEIDTSFTRTWNQEFEHEGAKVHFIGALEVRVVANYGIDLRDLRVKYEEDSNIVTVACVNPKFLSFKDLDYNWKISELMEYREPVFATEYWRKSDRLGELGAKIQEEFRSKTHQEMKNGPEELAWVIGPLKKQIVGALELVLGMPGRKVKIVDTFDDTFEKLTEGS